MKLAWHEPTNRLMVSAVSEFDGTLEQAAKLARPPREGLILLGEVLAWSTETATIKLDPPPSPNAHGIRLLPGTNAGSNPAGGTDR